MAGPDDELLNRVTWKIPNALALVGSRAGDEWNAMTTSWITQLSMEPVLVGVGVDNGAVTHRLIAAGGSFSVNLWAADDTRVFVKFSKPAAFDAEAMTLNGRAVRTGRTGAPIFVDAIAWLDCEVRAAHDLGTHTLFVGEVVDAAIADDEARAAAMSDTRMKYGGVKTRVSDPALVLGPHGVTPADVVAVARTGRQVELGEAAREVVERGAAVVERLVHQPEPVYGVSTGFGALANTVIPAERSAELQAALIRSHAAGLGPEIERETIRAMILLRARSLAMGYSGARPVVIETMLAVLNAGITPVVREHGSLGASGDLAPLASAALVLLGEGEVRLGDGTLVDGSTALASADIVPVTLRAKEGLALINGTDGMLGMLVLALADLDVLLRTADIAAAMSTEALLGTDRAFAEDLVAMRPQVGQAVSASNLRAVLDGSPLVASHRYGDDRVQDAYSLRCTPQVHGAARDTVDHARAIADRELVSFIDNPVVLPDGRVESCGNFHGAPVAAVADFLAISVADVGAISERRTDRLLDRARSHGLPPFLSPDAGVNSGLMIGHYTQAAMVAENRRLAVPASTDTLPTSAMQEDHVSLGWASARKLRVAVANLTRILAVELVAGTWGLHLRRPLQPATASGAVAAAVAAVAGNPGPDQWLSPRLAAVERLVADGSIVAAAGVTLR